VDDVSAAELCTPDELCERIEHVGRRSLAVTVEALQRDLRFAVQQRDDEIARLRDALKAVRDVASDRERFVRQGPRGFATAVRIVDNALGGAASKKSAVQP
jgi:hypothetical protein